MKFSRTGPWEILRGINTGNRAARAAPAALVLALGLAASLAAPGCAGHESVRGLIVEVQARGLLDLESMELVDEFGSRWVFEGSGTYGHFTPSHLRQHMVAGERVEVTFLREDGRLVIVGLSDYP